MSEWKRRTHWEVQGNPACLLIKAPYLSMSPRMSDVTCRFCLAKAEKLARESFA